MRRARPSGRPGPTLEHEMPPDDPVPAIGYIRVSTAREEMISPELQRAAITQWATRNNRRVIQWIEDLDKSGRNFKRRVQEAIAAVENRIAVEIIVWKFSRFGRQRLGWAVHLDRVESAGGQLQSATEEIDARTASGKFMRDSFANMAAFESDRASEGWKDTHAYRLSIGLPVHGTPRFGYVRRGKIPRIDAPGRMAIDPNDPKGERYEPDEVNAPILKGLYTRYVGGTGGMALTRWLNAHDIRTTRDGTWTIQSFFNVLDSGFGAGLLRVHPGDCTCLTPERCKNCFWVPGTHEPVISTSLWEEYRRRRATLRTYGPRARNPRHTYSGLVRCGCCKGAMGAQYHRGEPGHAYLCRNKLQGRCVIGAWVRRVVLEQLVRNWLSRAAAAIEARTLDKEARHAELAVARADHDKISHEIHVIDAALSRLVKQRLLDPDMPEEIYDQTRTELLAERRGLEKDLEAAADEKDAEEVDHLPVIRTLMEEWETLPPARRRDMLAKLVRHIIVYRQEASKAPKVVIVAVWDPED